MSLPPPMKHYKSLLIAQRTAIENALEDSNADRAPVELDQARVGRLSRMDALQMQAMASATASRRKQEVQRIDAALARIESGDYGYCLSCDEEIAPARLELDPATPNCIRCASGI